MAKEDIIKYVMNTPENTNPSVLKTMLDNMGSTHSKIEVELTVTESGIYTPTDSNTVFNKITVEIPFELVIFNVEVINNSNDYLYYYTPHLDDTNEIIVFDTVESGQTVNIQVVGSKNHYTELYFDTAGMTVGVGETVGDKIIPVDEDTVNIGGDGQITFTSE